MYICTHIYECTEIAISRQKEKRKPLNQVGQLRTLARSFAKTLLSCKLETPSVSVSTIALYTGLMQHLEASHFPTQFLWCFGKCVVFIVHVDFRPNITDFKSVGTGLWGEA